MSATDPEGLLLVERLLDIDKSINEMMNSGLSGGTVDVRRLTELQEEVRTLMKKLDEKPELKKLYNERVMK